MSNNCASQRATERRSPTIPRKWLRAWRFPFAYTIGLFLGALAAGPASAVSNLTLYTPTGVVGDQLAYSVASAGDVNGDGYSDWIVGAPTNAAAGTNAGAAYVYYGGPAADNVPDVVLAGTAAFAFFGYSVASAGDVNGDGYADVVVGGWNGGGGKGSANVYYGAPVMDGAPDLILTGQASTDQFGVSVSSAGDVNGDHYGDVVIGANQNDAGGTDAGRAYIYYGGTAPDAVADLTFTGAAAGDLFGTSVSGAGDLNGDGFGDVIVGAPHNSASGSLAGRAYVYFGGSIPDAGVDVILTGAAAGDNFGSAVSSAGDVNGDGFGDLIIGAPNNAAGGTSAGRAYVYYGGSTPDAVVDLAVTGSTGDVLGSSVSSGGDLNGDGFADLLVGAPASGPGGTNIGRASVYFGGPTPDAVADLSWAGQASGDRFGFSISSAGDVSGDGIPDVLVGAYQSSAGGAGAGRAYVVGIFSYQVLSPNRGETWVSGTSATVHWRGHDLADLAISYDGGSSWSTLATKVGGLEQNVLALTAPSTATSYAKVRLSYSGQTIRRSNQDASDGVFRIIPPVTPPAAAKRLQWTLTGTTGDSFGRSVASAGDINGDGYADVVVGAHLAGRASVYFGGPGADASPDLTLTGAAGELFGRAVASAGDVNGDGFGDLIIGAPNNGPGHAYVFYGGLSPDAAPDITLSGETNGDAFGISVASAGDVNGDGFSDMIVGAPNNSGVAGRAYVYFGGPSADTVPDLTLSGEASGDAFGFYVSGAGDMNGDVYNDVIVGAYQNAANGTLAGRAYVYYGGRTMDNVADLTLTGQAAGDIFGVCVSSAGDVNGDGYGDVIVGADGNSAGGASAGRAYVFYGGSFPDTSPDLVLTGIAGESFGRSAAGAGDVNGDGYSDLIVGAFNNSAAGANAGRAYLFFGGPGADTNADIVLTGEAAGDIFGNWVSPAGDVNGDGFADVIVAAQLSDAGGTDSGRAYLYDLNRYFVTAPNGGETWPVGALRTISWLGEVPANIWLSADGGKSYDLLLSGIVGRRTNSVSLRVPHTPSKFARVKITPADATLRGSDPSDSTFSIQTSVALLALLAAPAPQGGTGAIVSWSTNPGPDDLAGYRLETRSGGDWRTEVALTREMTYADPDAGPATQYRLFAVNGLGEELLLGETSFRPAASVSAWPLPYRVGNLSIAFATRGGLGGGMDIAKLSLFDSMGRLVRTLAEGRFPAGYQSAVWDGRDARGKKVAAGVYFLRLGMAGDERGIKVVVLR